MKSLFDPDTDERFRKYDEAHPEVWELFVHYCHKVMGAGIKRYSADLILQQIRWHHHVERGVADFKINDHFTSRYARKFLAAFPEHAGFFETRRISA